MTSTNVPWQARPELLRIWVSVVGHFQWNTGKTQTCISSISYQWYGVFPFFWWWCYGKFPLMIVWSKVCKKYGAASRIHPAALSSYFQTEFTPIFSLSVTCFSNGDSIRWNTRLHLAPKSLRPFTTKFHSAAVCGDTTEFWGRGLQGLGWLVYRPK